MKEEFLIMLEHGEISETETLAAINRLNYPLSELYSEWLDQDNSIAEDLKSTINHVATGWYEDTQEDTESDEEMEAE